MNESDQLDPSTHHEATLLPWYLTDTLDRQEKQDVETHLPNCERCQIELDEMKRTRAAVKASINEQTGPSSVVFEQVMARIREEQSSAETTIQRKSHTGPNLLKQIQAWIQSLFTVPWVPVLATIVIVGQSALLMTNLGNNQTLPDWEPVVPRGIPQAPSPSESHHIHIIFTETATQSEIQGLLQLIHAQIIRGPSLDGAYVLKISTNDLTPIEASLETLLAQPTIVRSATPANE